MTTYTGDKEWENFGKNNPYYGVLFEEKFKTENLNDETKNEFFTTGKNYVESIIAIIETVTKSKFKPQTALDFGCGAGRLTIPLAIHAGKITGIDISESILKEAAKNSEKFGLSNTDFKLFSDSVIADHKFDFINTYIVLQHIVVKRGTEIIKSMLSSLTENGIAVIHVTFSADNLSKMKLSQAVNPLIGKSVLLTSVYKALRKISKKVDFKEPFMQMNHYDLNKINKLLYDANCTLLHNEFTNHGGTIGSLMFIQKGGKKQYVF